MKLSRFPVYDLLILVQVPLWIVVFAFFPDTIDIHLHDTMYVIQNWHFAIPISTLLWLSWLLHYFGHRTRVIPRGFAQMQVWITVVAVLAICFTTHSQGQIAAEVPNVESARAFLLSCFVFVGFQLLLYLFFLTRSLRKMLFPKSVRH